MKRIALILLLLSLATLPALAQITAVVEETSGKVEIRLPGSNWATARVGMEVPTGATISTGFNSEAILAIGDSVLTVDPLTRMGVEELLQSEGVVKSSLRLNVGRVSADVQTAEGLQSDFQVKSPLSTASVRGTVFSFNGTTIEVSEGVVTITNSLGQTRRIVAGNQSTTDGESTPSGEEEELENTTTIVFSTSSFDDEAGEGDGTEDAPEVTTTGTLPITIQTSSDQ
jgi:hypothetical protein